MDTFLPYSITGVILAGGQGQRMGGQDKGLLSYQGKPLVHHAIEVLSKQVDKLIINANRNVEQYQQFGYPIVKDKLDGFCGPLAGMLSAMHACDTDYILTAPCDSPTISPLLRQRLMEVLLKEQADIAVAHDGNRMQPVFSLISCNLRDDLENYLMQGDRKIDLWFERHKLALVDFSDHIDNFVNFNRPEDIAKQQMITCPVPVLGFSAYSGTGKTTLLTQLIPKLNELGIRVAVIKHAHHQFEVDMPGKDSYRIRQVGAHQTLVASSRLMALMQTNNEDPRLMELIPRIASDQIDIILVEGFKHEQFAKIELHRPSLAKPLLHPDDDNIIAIASDEKLALDREIDQLNINDIAGIADYVSRFIANWTH